MLNDKDQVGYGRPPKNAQFAKGQSGNPRGRPRGSRSLAAILRQAGNDRVTVTIGGKSTTLSKLEAIAMQMANQAAAGDPKAVHTFLHWMTKTSDAEAALDPGVAVPDESDSRMMAQLMRRLKRLKPEGNEAESP